METVNHMFIKHCLIFFYFIQGYKIYLSNVQVNAFILFRHISAFVLHVFYIFTMLHIFNKSLDKIFYHKTLEHNFNI